MNIIYVWYMWGACGVQCTSVVIEYKAVTLFTYATIVKFLPSFTRFFFASTSVATNVEFSNNL